MQCLRPLRHQRFWVRAQAVAAVGDREVHGATHNWSSVVRGETKDPDAMPANQHVRRLARALVGCFSDSTRACKLAGHQPFGGGDLQTALSNPSQRHAAAGVKKSRWALILADYVAIREAVLNSPRLMTRTNLQLFELNQRTISQWYSRRQREGWCCSRDWVAPATQRHRQPLPATKPLALQGGNPGTFSYGPVPRQTHSKEAPPTRPFCQHTWSNNLPHFPALPIQDHRRAPLYLLRGGDGAQASRRVAFCSVAAGVRPWPSGWRK
ncbi:uncharacterized protein [Salvelinus sp. IW2-2015]|uniref:uncharacterized protein n=1 Tax=Salvelinus sp. IW2-2015 TaxID=2691554 RepID=UPI0038D373EC